MNTNLISRKTWTSVLVAVITLVAPVHAQKSVAGDQSPASISILDSTREQDGLVGSVRRVKIQSAKLEIKSGQVQEGPLQLLEVTTYGLSGNRINNASYLAAHSTVGKEEYQYDDRGIIVQMTLRGSDGSIFSREAYSYEFDTFGNWRKMVTHLVLFENGELKHEPVEVTYREIAYYFDDSVAKIVRPTSHLITLPAASSAIQAPASAVGPERQAYTFTSPDRTHLIEAGGEPPRLAEPAKNPSGTLARNNTKPTGSLDTKSGPRTIPITPATNASGAVARSAAPVPKETANNLPPARREAIAYYEKGREYFDLGALEHAVDFYRRSLELEPKSAEVYLSLGHAYLRLKKQQDAGKAFKQATVLDPDIAEAHYGLGLHYFGLDKYRNAAEAFKRATVLRPEMAKAHYGLALAYQELGKLDDLLAEFRILETLDRGLAKKLSETVPEFNLPCRASPLCK